MRDRHERASGRTAEKKEANQLGSTRTSEAIFLGEGVSDNRRKLASGKRLREDLKNGLPSRLFHSLRVDGPRHKDAWDIVLDLAD